MSKLVKLCALVVGFMMVGAGSAFTQERSPSDLVPRAPMTEATAPPASATNGYVAGATCAPVCVNCNTCNNNCGRQRCHRARRCRGCCR